MAEATLGGGCLWGLEAVYQGVRGVTSVKSGYAGGHLANPSYEQVCTGRTGHAEVVQITFDPAVVSYADLLRIFFTIHDPTTPNRQGNDVGTQYRSIILTHDEEQAATARAVIGEIAAAGLWDGEDRDPRLNRSTQFWPAEAEHDDYFNRNPFSGYCPCGGGAEGAEIP